MTPNFMRGSNTKSLLVGCYEFPKLFSGTLVWHNLAFSASSLKFGGPWHSLAARRAPPEFVNLDNQVSNSLSNSSTNSYNGHENCTFVYRQMNN